MTDLGAMLVTYRADITDLGNKINQAKSDMSSMSDSAQSSGGGIMSAFSGMGGGLISFIQNAGMTIASLQGIGQAAISTAQAFLQPAATAETTQLSFETLLHSTKAAQSAMTDLNTYAASTPMQTQWVDDAAAKILAFGGKMGDVKPEITAIGDALSGLGKLSDASLNSIVDIFGKISAQGKITGGDMMQLSTWGIPAWQELSDAMHKPIPELQKMVSAGLIPASQALPALEQGMEKTFGGGMAKQANTFTGLMSTLASNWQIFMAALGSPVLKLTEQGLNGIGAILASPAFQSFGTSVGQKIADAFQQIGGFVSKQVVPAFQQLGPVIGQIGAYLQGDSFQGFIADVETVGNQISLILTPAFQALGPYIPSLSQSLQGIGNVVSGVLVPALDNIVFPLGQFLIWMQQAGPWQDVIKAGLIGIGVAFAAIQIGAFIATIPALVAGFITWAAAAWTAAAGTIAATWPILAIGAAIAIVVAIIVLAVQHWSDITKFLSSTWSSFTSWFMGLINGIGAWFSASWSSIAGFFVGLWTGAIANFKATIGAVSSWWSGIWTGIQNIGKLAWNAIVGVFKAGAQLLFDAIFGPINEIVNLFSWLYDHNYYFKDLVDSIVNFFKGCFDWLHSKWDDFTAWIAGIWTGISTKASQIWGQISGTVSQKSGEATNWLSDNWNKATTATGNFFEMIGRKTVEGWNFVSAVFQYAWTKYIEPPLLALWNSVTTWFTGLWTWVETSVVGAWTAISTIFSHAWSTYIASPLQGIWNQFTGWFSNLATSAWNSGSNFVKMIADGIASGAGWIWNAVVNIANTIWKALGFHSPAKAGPGADADKWMPNFINMLSSGLTAGAPQVQKASSVVAQALAYPIRPSASTVASAAPLQGSSSGAKQSVHLHLHMGSMEYTAFIDDIGSNLVGRIRLQTGARI